MSALPYATRARALRGPDDQSRCIAGSGEKKRTGQYAVLRSTEIVESTNMADQERVSGDALHRLEQKVFQLEVLDAEALRARALSSASCFVPLSALSAKSNTHIEQSSE